MPKLSYNLNVTVITPLGKFVGRISNSEEVYSLEQITEGRNSIQGSLNRLTSLVIYAEDGEEICFNEHILKESVLQFKIVSALYKE